METDFFEKRSCYFGDIHNHCGISYGHGPLEAALQNAAMQLDFVSITGHAGWPDMDERPMPKEVVEYHQKGFSKLKENRLYYAERMNEMNTKGSFITFGGYELHSFRYGDYTILQKDPLQSHQIPESGDAMRELLSSVTASQDDLIFMPHHIGYKTGFRGIDWDSFNPEASPLVEIISMHGCAESPNSPFPYLHTMGPLDDACTIQAGLERGYIFGVTGSTDHHSSHPGSYGYGKTAVWAEELSRESIWQAFLERRVYAVSGDKIICAFSVNGEPMGGTASESKGKRTIRFKVKGGDALSRIEILKNNSVWHQKNYIPGNSLYTGGLKGPKELKGKILFEMGWGEKRKIQPWQVKIQLKGIKKMGVEPRFRGVDVVDPLDDAGNMFSFTRWGESAEDTVELETASFGNATAVTSQTQGICIDISGDRTGEIELTVNGTSCTIPLAELLESGRVMYTAGFLSPACKVHRFVPEAACRDEIVLQDPDKKPGDQYYARVFQVNGHAAWTSPVKIS
ncbi:MAG: DUF3604 domain-containing protein [Spirochaetales bacterium]|nr:DUF3604 domain-containing protein [Spirochaetales bacterium]